MTECSLCSSPLFEYVSGDWLEWICWECGYYKSDSPAYKSNPTLFENIVRENPKKFVKKYLYHPFYNTTDATPEDSTEPLLTIFKYLFTKQGARSMEWLSGKRQSPEVLLENILYLLSFDKFLPLIEER